MKTYNFAIEDIGLDAVSSVGSAQTDGRALVALSLASTLADRGHRVDILVRKPRRLHPYWASKIGLRCVSSDILPDTTEQGTSYDLLLVNHWSVEQRIGSTPFVYLPHEIEFLRPSRTGEHDSVAVAAQKQIMRRAVGVLVPSRKIYRWMLEQKIISAERLLLAPYGIDSEVFQPRERISSREKTGIDQHKKFVFYVGALERRKGLDVLMEAFDKLPRSVNLFIIGGLRGDASDSDKKLWDKLCQWANRTRNSNRVCLAGAKPWFDLPDYYSAADVVALPSLMEPFGLPTAEAIACGAPVVGTKIDGFLELVRPEKDGILVEPNDEAALADAITRILDNPEWQSTERRLERAEHGRTFSWDRAAITLEKITSQLCCNKVGLTI